MSNRIALAENQKARLFPSPTTLTPLEIEV
jgi:hypothetical protein